MNKLKQINKNIQKKQILRLVMTCGSVAIGTIAFAKYMYQAGITDTQKQITHEFPEEYASMTEKVCKAFEK